MSAALTERKAIIRKHKAILVFNVKPAYENMWDRVSSSP